MSEPYIDSRGLLSLVDQSAVGLRDHISRLAEAFYAAVPSDCATFINAGGSQGNATPNTARKLQLGSAVISHGVTLTSGTDIKVSTPGVYNVQFSLQLTKTDSGDDDVDIWIGTDLGYEANSNTRVTVPGNDGKAVAAWNYVVELTPARSLSLYWSSADSAISIATITGLTSPTRPDIPAVILSVVKVR